MLRKILKLVLLILAFIIINDHFTSKQLISLIFYIGSFFYLTRPVVGEVNQRLNYSAFIIILIFEVFFKLIASFSYLFSTFIFIKSVDVVGSIGTLISFFIFFIYCHMLWNTDLLKRTLYGTRLYSYLTNKLKFALLSFVIILTSLIAISAFVLTSPGYRLSNSVTSANKPEDEKNFDIDPRKVMLPDTANRGFSDKTYEIFHGKNDLNRDYSKNLSEKETRIIFDYYRLYRSLFTVKDIKKSTEEFSNYEALLVFCINGEFPSPVEFKDGFAEPNPNIPTNAYTLCTKRFYQLVKEYNCKEGNELEEFCHNRKGEYEFKW